MLLVVGALAALVNWFSAHEAQWDEQGFYVFAGFASAFGGAVGFVVCFGLGAIENYVAAIRNQPQSNNGSVPTDAEERRKWADREPPYDIERFAIRIP